MSHSFRGFGIAVQQGRVTGEIELGEWLLLTQQSSPVFSNWVWWLLRLKVSSEEVGERLVGEG